MGLQNSKYLQVIKAKKIVKNPALLNNRHVNSSVEKIVKVPLSSNSSLVNSNVKKNVEVFTSSNSSLLNSTVEKNVNIPILTSQSLQNPSHRLEDVIDYIQYRIVGNGIIIKIVKTVAWSIDDLYWRCCLLGEKIDYRLYLDLLPTQEYGIQCEPQLPLNCLCELFNPNGILVAKGDLMSFFVEQKLNLST